MNEKSTETLSVVVEREYPIRRKRSGALSLNHS
jgi:hypothetical protein